MEETYFCTVTRIKVSLRRVPPFLRASGQAANAARATPGNMGTRLLGLPGFPYYFTMTVWDSTESLMSFIKTAEHRAAMAGMPVWARQGKFKRFATDTPKVSWRRAWRELRDPDGVWTPTEGSVYRDKNRAFPTAGETAERPPG